MMLATCFVFFMNIQIQQGLVIDTYDNLAIIQTEDENCFGIVDDEIECGDVVSVVFDTKGTADRADDEVIAMKVVCGKEL